MLKNDRKMTDGLAHRFQCPQCKKICQLPASELGNTVGCGHCGAPIALPADWAAPGTVLGDYIIAEQLGCGTTERTFAAHQVSLARPVVLKVLLDDCATTSALIVAFVRNAREVVAQPDDFAFEVIGVGEDAGHYYTAYKRPKSEAELTAILAHEIDADPAK